MKRQIAIVRHGSVSREYHGRYIGRTDVPLDVTGMEQALSTGRFLRSGNFSSCVCSPMARTAATAGIIAEETNVPVSTEDFLREIDFGNWEGMSFNEVSSRFPGDVKQWLSAGDDFVFPGGESIRDFHRRVEEAADRILKSESRNQIVVTHGGVVRVLLCLFLGIPFKHAHAFNIMYGATALIELNDDESSVGQLVYLRNSEVVNG
ncbi:MAG: alpha-ribazole phosphatase [Candidatus Sabulitectum sp.]|nr:alpha-ribazole phosphatase [Candidatus Sabulitectum sp.]